MPWGSQSMEAYYRPGWIVYLLEGKQGYYVGITQDLDNRVEQHLNSKTPSSARLDIQSLVAWRSAGEFITASKLERYIHATKRYHLITDPSSVIPNEVSNLPDSIAEGRVRWILNRL